MTLGQLFNSKRIELGRSLEQISASTKIHVKILSALEQDQYSDLPARAFSRGFIVSYCKALKLDSEEVLKNYHDFLESKFKERDDRDKGHQGYVFEGKELEQNRRGLIIGASVAAFFAIAVLLIFKPQNHHRKEKHKEFEEEVVASPSTETATSVAPVVASANPSTTPTLVIESKTTTTAPVALVLTSSPKVSVSASAAPKASIAPSPTVVAVAVAVAKATVVPTIQPSATPLATAVAAVATTSPSPKPDQLNKGDDLGPKEFTRRINFKAVEDTWVRYKIDQKAPMTFILRKGRQLVIKAKESLKFETSQSSALQFRTRGSTYKALEQSVVSVEADGTVNAIEAGSVAPGTLPVAIPASPNP